MLQSAQDSGKIKFSDKSLSLRSVWMPLDKNLLRAAFYVRSKDDMLDVFFLSQRKLLPKPTVERLICKEEGITGNGKKAIPS